MNTTLRLASTLRRVFDGPPHGIVGLVDDLLRLCPIQGVQICWHAESCRLRALADGSEEVLERLLPKPVFRAILARVATLCNEQTPNSVSPYGGQGKLLVGNDPPAVFKVTFTNTTCEQKLELIPMTVELGDP